MKNRGVEVVDVDRIANGVIAVVVRLTERCPSSHPRTGQQHRVATRMVIAAIVGGRDASL